MTPTDIEPSAPDGGMSLSGADLSGLDEFAQPIQTAMADERPKYEQPPNDHDCSCADVKCCLCDDAAAKAHLIKLAARREARDRENQDHYEARGEW